MNVVSIVGARPQFVKLAPVARAFAKADVHHTIVHTGQHYDAGLSQVFFDELAIAAPDVNLGVGSGSHAEQTAKMMTGLETVLGDVDSDWVLTYGDTNSTLAAAVVAAKMLRPTAHLEAGLRSFNRAMPEEHNRVLTDHASDLLLAPSEVALQNLAREGLADRTVLVGDVMLDVALEVKASLDHVPEVLDLPDGPFVLATIHRQENTDSATRLREILRALRNIAIPVVLPAHPRLRSRCDEFGLELGGGNIQVRSPLTYRQMVAALTQATSVVTDSGGVQKEAYFFAVPCTTLRAETEWTETLVDGWNVLADDLDLVPEFVLRPPPTSPPANVYGDGASADRVVQALLKGTPTGSDDGSEPVSHIS